jgi:hypothetical protein
MLCHQLNDPVDKDAQLHAHMAVGVEGQVHRHGLKRPVFQHRGELSTRKVSVAIVNGQGVLISFQQAIRNVVANAIRLFFSPPGSAIELLGRVDSYGQIQR